MDLLMLWHGLSVAPQRNGIFDARLDVCRLCEAEKLTRENLAKKTGLYPRPHRADRTGSVQFGNQNVAKPAGPLIITPIELCKGANERDRSKS
jgi:hypothetical protein